MTAKNNANLCLAAQHELGMGFSLPTFAYVPSLKISQTIPYKGIGPLHLQWRVLQQKAGAIRQCAFAFRYRRAQARPCLC